MRRQPRFAAAGICDHTPLWEMTDQGTRAGAHPAARRASGRPRQGLLRGHRSALSKTTLAPFICCNSACVGAGKASQPTTIDNDPSTPMVGSWMQPSTRWHRFPHARRWNDGALAANESLAVVGSPQACITSVNGSTITSSVAMTLTDADSGLSRCGRDAGRHAARCSICTAPASLSSSTQEHTLIALVHGALGQCDGRKRHGHEAVARIRVEPAALRKIDDRLLKEDGEI
jgi:hypothetical protein